MKQMSTIITEADTGKGDGEGRGQPEGTVHKGKQAGYMDALLPLLRLISYFSTRACRWWPEEAGDGMRLARCDEEATD
ncbi:hypothetical protein E2C01_060939 [Portunus trituberculatus]|uniref:Uncharacterized protein n=1 Tax=Portunus trituberculatus TaxID=210409 RepID=A0A5B7HA18_PORTR|nr:hypothetical protein [Portunus trituberculatus]